MSNNYITKTYEQFKQENIGEKIDLDGFPKGAIYQCWDLGQKAFNELWELDYWLFCKWSGGVKDIWEYRSEMFDLDDWEFEQNEYHTIPQQKDIVIFDGRFGGGYGHIGIVESANINTLTILEQNAGQGDGDGKDGDETRVSTYPNYRGVYGFIRRKTIPVSNTMPQVIMKPTMPTSPVFISPSYEELVKQDKSILNRVLQNQDTYFKESVLTQYPELHARVSNNDLKGILQLNIENKTLIVGDEVPIITNNLNKLEAIQDKKPLDSKKFIAFAISILAGVGIAFISPENSEMFLAGLGGITATYLGGQSFVDRKIVEEVSGLVKQIKK